MIEKLLMFVDKFTPPAIRNADTLSWHDRVRTWSMLLVLMLSLAIPIGALVIFGLLHVFTSMDFSHALIILLSLAFVILVQHIYFYSYGKLQLTANAYAAQAFLSYCLVISYTGGWHSPVMVLLLCSPIVAFMTGGYALGMTSILAVAFALLSFCYLHIQHIALPNVIRPENFEIVVLSVWATLLLMMAIFFIVTNAMLLKKPLETIKNP